jgi:hypothetical protein
MSILELNDGTFDISNNKLNVYESNVVLTQNYGNGGITEISSNMFNIINSNVNISKNNPYLGLNNTWTGKNLFNGDISFININTLINSLNNINLSSGSVNISSGSVNISGGTVNISGGPINIGAAKLASLDVSGNATLSGTNTLSGTTTVSGATTVSGNTTFNNATTQISSTSLIGLSGGVVNISGGVVNINGTTNLRGATTLSGLTTTGAININGSAAFANSLSGTGWNIGSTGDTILNNASTQISSSSVVGISSENVNISGGVINIGRGNVLVGTGNVGVGTNNPGYKLDVNGDANVSGSFKSLMYITTKSFYLTSGNNSSSAAQFIGKVYNGGLITVYIRSDGYDHGEGSIAEIFCGYGSTPLVRVFSGYSSRYRFYYILTSNGNTYLWVNEIGGYAGQSIYYECRIYCNNPSNFYPTTTDGNVPSNATQITNGQYMLGNGNVGIGTTNPQYTLDVSGTAIFSGDIISNNGNISINNSKGFYTNCTEFPYSHNAERATTFLTISEQATHTAGFYMNYVRKYPYNASGDPNWPVLTQRVDFNFLSNNNNSNYQPITTMTINNYGNVGIGTTNPATILDIYGSQPIIKMKTSGGNLSNDTMGIEFFNGYTITKPQGCIHVVEESKNMSGVWGSSMRFRTYYDQTDYERMRILANGNVGIGTTSPGYKLQVNGSVGILSTNFIEFGVGITKEGNAGRIGYNTFSSTALDIVGSGTANNYRKVRIYDLLGIGTSDPKFPIDIPRRVRPFNPIISYFNGATTSATNISGTISYSGNAYGPTIQTLNGSTYGDNNDGTGWSICCNGILASEFGAFSDSRIKNNIVDIDDEQALHTLRLIKPKTYDYVDKIHKGNANVIGFIAQEIKEIIPKAITIIKDYIPNFYTRCQVSATDASNILLVTSPIDLSWNALHDDLSGIAFMDADGNACSDASGNKVFKIKLYDQSNNEIICKTTDVLDKRSFLMDITGTKMLDSSGNLVLETDGGYFLYGQEVDDFHTLDKNAIFTVVTAAVQDIDRIQQAQAGQIQSQAGQIQAQAGQIQAQQASQMQMQASQMQIQAYQTQILQEQQADKAKIQELENKVAMLEQQNAQQKEQIAAILARLGM